MYIDINERFYHIHRYNLFSDRCGQEPDEPFVCGCDPGILFKYFIKKNILKNTILYHFRFSFDK